MKHLKLFEDFNIDWEDWDEEETMDDDKTYKDIPIYKNTGNRYDDKDFMRIENLYRKYGNEQLLLRHAQTMANRITHIDKAIKRGNAARLYNPIGFQKNPDLEEIFYKRAADLYFKRI